MEAIVDFTESPVVRFARVVRGLAPFIHGNIAVSAAAHLPSAPSSSTAVLLFSTPFIWAEGCDTYL